MGVHAKKCHPDSFQAIWDGRKAFEWRKEDDCRYEVGDTILLLEWEPKERITWQGMTRVDVPLGYTGRVLRVGVTYVLRGKFGVPDGFAVLGVERVSVEQPRAAVPCGMLTKDP